MTDEVKKESKDQRRLRLNREGKELLKNGQNHLITDQHQRAMDYFTRKRKSDNSTRVQRRTAEEGVARPNRVATRATGEAAPTTGEETTAGYAVRPEQRDKVFKKLTKEIRQWGEDEPKMAGIAAKMSPKIRSIKLGAINEDNVHHSYMATIADHLSDKLEDADAQGILSSKDTKDIDKALFQAHRSINKSAEKHDEGQIEDAKVHMMSAHQNLHSAIVQMEKKGFDLNPELKRIIKTTAEGYTRSTRPGEGAMPHSKFRPPKAKSETASLDPDSLMPGPNAKKVSGEPLADSEGSGWTEDSSDNSLNNVDEAVSMVGRQLRAYAPVPAGVPKGKK